jgi:TonB dependent receptor/TonB-dependent Receptor Plug Domain
VQSLPGVGRSSFSNGQLVVWGSAPRETRVYVDGVEIPALYHGSGIRSTVSSDLVKSIELVPGAYGAEYGRGLGGLVRVETKGLPKEGTHGFVAIDTLDASTLVSTALTDRVRVAVAGRYGYLDRELPLVTSRDVSDVYPIPRYGDYQARVEADLRKGEQLRLTFLGSRDDLRRAVLSADPAATQAEDTSSAFQRLYASYTYRMDDGSDVSVTPFVGRDTTGYAASFGGNPARLDVASWRYGARTSYATRADIGPVHATVAIGLDALGSASDVARQGSLNLPPREGDLYVFGQPPGDDVAADAFQTHILNVAPYATAQLEAGAFTFEPGARLEGFLIEGSRSTPRVGQTPSIGFSRLEGGADPRIRVRWKASPRFSAVAAAGTYHQAPEPEELSAVFGTPALGLAKATHGSLGEALEITRTLSLEVTTFYKKLTDLTVRSRLTTPLLARALVQDGEGRSYGAQMLLRQRPWRGLFGWVSYTMTRSERRYTDEQRWRLFDYDQPHVLTAVIAKELGTWEVGLRLRAATGMPRTPVVGSLYDVRDDRYQPLFGDHNSIRIPAFFALDARVQKSFHLTRDMKLDVFVDAQNVTFHENKEEIVYGFDFTKRSYITGLPTLAVVGGRLEL